MWLWIRYAETLYIIKFKILQNFFSVLSLKEIIIIIIIIPEILFDTEYIAFSVYFDFVFLLLARQSLYKYNFVLTRSSVLRESKHYREQTNERTVVLY